jgi:hypothetical protein
VDFDTPIVSAKRADRRQLGARRKLRPAIRWRDAAMTRSTSVPSSLFGQSPIMSSVPLLIASTVCINCTDCLWQNFAAAPPIEAKTERDRWTRPERLDQRLDRRADLQRLAAGDAGGGDADFDPVFLTAARAAIAGMLALALLLAFRQKRPERKDLVSLAVVALSVVVGFPLLTALALKHVTSAHSIVFIGLLPLATAIFGVLRGGERPRRPSGCSPASAARSSPASR